MVGVPVPWDRRTARFTSPAPLDPPVPAYRRDRATEYREIDRFEGGVGWLAHPDEDGRRASHAVDTPEGTWLFDPVDAAGVDDLFDEVAGVAVLADYHVRDAAALARRHDVPVTIPEGADRAAERIDAPVERVPVDGTVDDLRVGDPDDGGRDDRGVPGVDLYRVSPMGLWTETLAHRSRDGTLYAPDFLSAHAKFTAGDERVGIPTLSRLSPPVGLAALDPDRILFGHGDGLFEDAGAALRDCLEGARGRLPRALVENLPGELRLMLGALR